MSECIVLASDHAGFEVKEHIKTWLQEQGIACIDVGANSNERCDYPVYANKAVEAIEQKKATAGLLFCGSGIGMSIAANRHKGIRAALIHTLEEGKLAKEHNNANILCFGARQTSLETIKAAILMWQKASFLEGRYSIRNEMLKKE